MLARAPSPSVLDLFAGACGGWSLGLHRAGFTTIAAAECDPWRRQAFARNNPGAVLYDDVRTVTRERVINDTGRLPDIVAGSPPCQDASSANSKGRGVDGERTGLFFEAVRIVAQIRPRWAAFENVASIRTRGIDRVLSALEAEGYTVEAFVVGADDIGAPHERKRSWIIAFDTARVREPWAALPDACGDGREERDGAEPSAPEVPQSVCDLAKDWPDWASGLGRHLRLDHGLSAGLARRQISAFGDAVVPEIPYRIGRAIFRVEAALACE
jgi:DNA (cytosine-5)-methyltransferase 1